MKKKLEEDAGEGEGEEGEGERDAHERQRAYRRYVLSLFQRLVGVKQQAHVQLIVLDNLRIKLKWKPGMTSAPPDLATSSSAKEPTQSTQSSRASTHSVNSSGGQVKSNQIPVPTSTSSAKRRRDEVAVDPEISTDNNKKSAVKKTKTKESPSKSTKIVKAQPTSIAPTPLIHDASRVLKTLNSIESLNGVGCGGSSVW